MSNEAKRLVDVSNVNSVSQSDYLFVDASTAVRKAPVGTVFANSSVQFGNVVIKNTSTPANSTANVAAGTIWFDANYVYVAVANSVIKRASLSSF